jgi:tyrosyl-tRNA synthetase
VLRTEHLVSEAELVERLKRDRPLRIKLGCDPSAPDLHLGHSIVLDKLRALAELGHTIIFLVGDFTAMIGDPSGRSRTRPALARDEIARNAETYREQVSLILDVASTELRFNSEWMDSMTPADLIRLASHQPVARMLERDDFKNRFRSGETIAIHEFLYPLVQAYDSVALQADVEIGGTDQLFNLLLGREIQRAYGQDPQIVLTTPLLEGTMSIPDALLPRWVRLLPWTGLPGPDGYSDPRDLKAALAWRIVERFRGAEAARAAEAHFDRLFRHKEAPQDLEERAVSCSDPAGIRIGELLRSLGFAESGAEAKRLVAQGGVRVDDERLADVGATVPPGEHLLQVGKRRFARVRIEARGG